MAEVAALFRAQHHKGGFPGGQLVARRGGKTIVDEAIGIASGLREGEPKIAVDAEGLATVDAWIISLVN